MSFVRDAFTCVLLALAASPFVHAAAITTIPVLAPGTQYRLIFVTSGVRDARSSDISDYNAFVQAQALLSPELAALGTLWTAIGSTRTVDARDNTSSNPDSAAGVAFFQLDGLLVANGNADLWDGTLAAAINKDPFGRLHDNAAEPAWTGTDEFGHASVNPLGGSVAFAFAQFGQPGNTDSGWVNVGSSNIADGVTDLNSMFAISGVLVAPGSTAVPEPASLLLVCLGLAGLGSLRRRRTPRAGPILEHPRIDPARSCG